MIILINIHFLNKINNTKEYSTKEISPTWIVDPKKWKSNLIKKAFNLIFYSLNSSYT